MKRGLQYYIESGHMHNRHRDELRQLEAKHEGERRRLFEKHYGKQAVA